MLAENLNQQQEHESRIREAAEMVAAGLREGVRPEKQTIIATTHEKLLQDPTYAALLLQGGSGGMQLLYDVSSKVAQKHELSLHSVEVRQVFNDLAWIRNGVAQTCKKIFTQPAADAAAPVLPHVTEALVFESQPGFNHIPSEPAPLSAPRKEKKYGKSHVSNRTKMPKKVPPPVDDETPIIYQSNAEYDFDPGGEAIGVFREEVLGPLKDGEEPMEYYDVSGVDTSPTQEDPGSDTKAAILAARYAAGLPLWHPDDAVRRPLSWNAYMWGQQHHEKEEDDFEDLS